MAYVRLLAATALKMSIDFDNIEKFSIPLDKYPFNWLFLDEDKTLPTIEHQDQIFALTKEAANFLWSYESAVGIVCSDKYYKSITTFDIGNSDDETIKKYLFNLGIPFAQKVFIAMQPDMGLVLTWKMVIKYWDKIFWANDQTVWDKTLNWKLEFHHDGQFVFGRDLIHDGQIEFMKNRELFDKSIKEMDERKRGLRD